MVDDVNRLQMRCEGECGEIGFQKLKPRGISSGGQVGTLNRRRIIIRERVDARHLVAVAE
jgi:hypothetical protein